MNESQYRVVKTILMTATITIASMFVSNFMKEQTRQVAERTRQDNEFFCNGAPITLEKDDTLYWVVRTNCEGNIMNVVNKVIKVYGTDLIVGKTIYLPTHPNCELRLTDGGQVITDECVGE